MLAQIKSQINTGVDKGNLQNNIEIYIKGISVIIWYLI